MSHNKSYFEVISLHKSIFFSEQDCWFFFPSNFSVFIKFPIFFSFWFHLRFPCFYASAERDGLTRWALETCWLPPDPPKSLLPYWTVICPNSTLFPANKEAESMWGKRARSPVKATSLLRQLSSKKTAREKKERKKESEASFWKVPNFSMKKGLSGCSSSSCSNAAFSSSPWTFTRPWARDGSTKLMMWAFFFSSCSSANSGGCLLDRFLSNIFIWGEL